MSDSINIAVIGEKDIILPFRAIGFSVFYDTNKESIIKRCRRLAEQDCKIILITEKEAEKVGDYLNSRAAIPYPIIMPIPDGITSSDYSTKHLAENIEKAVGQKTGGNI